MIPVTGEIVSNTEEILRRNDVPTPEEIDHIATDIGRGNLDDIVSWLDDIAQCDGTNNEAKLATILRGLLLATRDSVGRYYNNDPE